jgi:ryanodine receptor 2
MERKTYIPKPIDTSDIELSEELMELTEEMAKNVHDVWSAGRIAQGWTWGPKRDDEKKENPCLVPYEELPESEKEYDRNTSIETLKVILSLGFKIER